jgi:16S rRNA (guanine966-N2)-methyltransferase
MRIISGYLGGRKIKEKLPSGIRPTTDMSREWLFNTLDNIVDFEDLIFLDLFSGSGAVGIEAISRGANSHFIDKSKHSLNFVKNSIHSLSIEQDKYSVIKNDSLKFLKKTELLFDIIFIDPPYETSLATQSLDIILERNIFSNSIIIIETQAYKNIDMAGFNLIKEKKMGNSIFFIIKKTSTQINQ